MNSEKMGSVFWRRMKTLPAILLGIALLALILGWWGTYREWHIADGHWDYNDGLRALEEERFAEAYASFSRSAEEEYAPAFYAIGYLRFYGLGVEESRAKAIRWFQKAAEAGDEEAGWTLNMITSGEENSRSKQKER